MALKIGILGKGNVGQALGRGLAAAGHEVRYGHRDPAEPVREAAAWAEVVFLAVPFPEVGEAVWEAHDALDGKVLVDVTNNLDQDYELGFGASTSGAEQLQKFCPRARVVKAFNTVFAETMEDGRVAGQALTVFAAGDDAEAKAQVLQLARDIGFDALDAGPLKRARALEPMAVLNIALGRRHGSGGELGFQVARAGTGPGEAVSAVPGPTRGATSSHR